MSRRQFMGAAAALASALFVPKVFFEIVRAHNTRIVTIRERVHQPFMDEMLMQLGIGASLSYMGHLYK